MKTYREQVRDIWAAVDWNKKDAQISYEMDVAITTVMAWRSRITGQYSGFVAGEKYNVDWEKLDWSKNNSMLSREVGIGYQAIGKMRVRLNKPYPTKNAFNTKFTQEQIDLVDWEWTKDIAIAKQLGISRERVRQLRNQLQKPKCKVASLEDAATAIVKWANDHRSELEGKTLLEASEIIPKDIICLIGSRAYLYQILRKHTDIEFKPHRKHHADGFNWDNVNWKLPNILLAMIYAFPNHRIAITRYQRFKDAPIWRLGGYSRVVNNPEFLSELDAEKQKAKELGINVDEKRIEEWMVWKRNYILNKHDLP